MSIRQPILALLFVVVPMSITKAQSLEKQPVAISPPRIVGHVERLDPQLDELIDPNARVELLSEGHLWTEGPVWISKGGYLLFSDIPRNSIYKWKEGEGLSLYLKPSGYTGDKRKGGQGADGVDELGSNGLALDADDRLVLCQHGDRCVSRLDGPPLSADSKPEARFTKIADRWEGKRFNSPNDVVVHSSGAVYFTDPPYGLQKGGDMREQDIDFNGVYRAAPDGTVTLVTREMTKPNGLAFSPDEKTLYIGQSDSAAPVLRAFPVNADGSLGKPQLFFDASELVKKGLAGSPDGFKVDKQGNVFTTGPGGLLVVTPEGKHLGTILTGDLVANCAFGDDGSTLYMCSNHNLCRVKLKTKGF